MRSVEEAIVTRLTGDATLVALLGGSGRVYHALEKVAPQIGSVTYQNLTTFPSGDLNVKNVQVREEVYAFYVYHAQYEDVLDRLFRLLHQYQFPTPSDAGIATCQWDWEGPDDFDEDLKVGKKVVRYKIVVIRKALAPI